MFAASLFALTLFACCFASLANNAPSPTLWLPKKEFSLKSETLLTQALLMFCRQSKVAFFTTRTKDLVAFVCVQFIITSFPSFHKPMKVFLHLPILSGEMGLHTLLSRERRKGRV